MSKLKIGMILDNTFPPDPRVKSEAKILINSGYDVTLFALSFSKHEKKEEICDGIRVFRHYINNFFYKKLSPLVYTFPFYNMFLRRVLKKFLADNNFDVIHIHDMAIAGLVFKINNEFGLPIILDLHENRPEIMKAYSHVNSGLGKYLISTDKWGKKQSEFIKKADRVIVVTEEAKSDLINQLNVSGNKITPIPNTVDYPEFPNQEVDKDLIGKFSDGFKILYIGATGIRRGLDIAIKAIALLRKNISDVKLIVVGKSRDDDYLLNLSKELDVESNIAFEGWQNFNLLPSYIKVADVGISPLKRNKHHDTTLANKIFQYMSLGVPIIVSDCPSQANIVHETGAGLVFKASSENDLAVQIEYLYNNPEDAKDMGNKGLQAVKTKYNWKYTGVNLLKLYESIK